MISRKFVQFGMEMQSLLAGLNLFWHKGKLVTWTNLFAHSDDNARTAKTRERNNDK